MKVVAWDGEPPSEREWWIPPFRRLTCEDKSIEEIMESFKKAKDAYYETGGEWSYRDNLFTKLK